MLKYGSLNNVLNQNSKTLLPRNLTLNSSLNTTKNNIIITNTVNSDLTNNTTTQTNINISDASIDNLNVTKISASNNSINPYIICDGPIAFSLLRSEYMYHNFKIYPILFTQDILINNKNLELNSDSIIIKDNVLVINNDVKNNSLLDNTTDVFITGIIFPIIDQNSSTGYYSGLLYLPNNKIEKVSPTSTIYKWTNNKYLIFKNLNKGFYKLKYLSQNNNFLTYKNTLTSTYVDLFDNNDDLSNLIVNSIAITDGELVAFNNEYLNIMLGDQDNQPINIITFNKTNIHFKNNIDMIFDTSLTIKNFIDYLKFYNNLITFYTDIFFNNNNSFINFTDKLTIISNGQSFLSFDYTNNRIEFNKDVIVNTLIILSNLELNFKDLFFGNEFNIGSLINNIFVPFLNFTNTSTNQSLNLLINSYVNNLFINNNLTFNSTSKLTFENILNIISSSGDTYFNINNINKSINFDKIINVSDITISSSILLNNQISIKVINDFKITDIQNNLLINFNSSYLRFFYNLYINKFNPKITFDDLNTIEISSINPNIKLQVNQNSIIINGPSNSNSTTLNVIVGSSLNITNISCNFESGLNIFNFIPTAKLYVLSGATKPTENISFVFQSVYSIPNENTTQFSGKLNITSRAMDGNFINIYNINIWTTPLGTVEYDTIIPINNNLLGDWSINNFILTLVQPMDNGDYYNIQINCNGSLNYNIIWGIKLDGLSI